jgi:hypothetical protein
MELGELVGKGVEGLGGLPATLDEEFEAERFEFEEFGIVRVQFAFEGFEAGEEVGEGGFARGGVRFAAPRGHGLLLGWRYFTMVVESRKARFLFWWWGGGEAKRRVSDGGGRPEVAQYLHRGHRGAEDHRDDA